MKAVLLLLIIIGTSCSVFTGYKKSTFTYTANNQAQTIYLKVPAGYERVENGLDSTGNKQQVYYYSSGSILYFTQAIVSKENQQIDTAENKPSLHPAGGLLYKGFNNKATYWKEYQQDSLRFGYKNVPYGLEGRFDSAVNYAGYRKVRR